MVSFRVSSRLEANWKFASWRKERRPKKVAVIITIKLENAISLEDMKKDLKYEEYGMEFLWKFMDKTYENIWKIPSPAGKENEYWFFLITSHLLKCSSDKKSINQKQIAENTGYWPIPVNWGICRSQN